MRNGSVDWLVENGYCARCRLRRIRKVLAAGPGRLVDAKSPVQAVVDFVPRLEDRRAKRRALKALAA